MSTVPTLEEKMSMARLTYCRRNDITYRADIVLQSLMKFGFPIVFANLIGGEDRVFNSRGFSILFLLPSRGKSSNSFCCRRAR
jgi:hypothetical protein